MKWPGQDNIDRAPETQGGFELPPEGRYDLTLTNVKTRDVRSGTWMTFELTIDNGEHKGKRAEDEMYFPEDGNPKIALAKLASFCDAAGWWPPLDEGEEIAPRGLAMLFPVNQLRANADCEHEYSIKAFLDVDSYKDYTQFQPEESEATPHGPKWLTVDKDTFDEWPEDKRWSKLRVAKAFGIDLQFLYQEPQEGTERATSEADEDQFRPKQDDMPF